MQVIPLLATGVIGYFVYEGFISTPGHGGGLTNVRGSDASTPATIQADINQSAEDNELQHNSQYYSTIRKFAPPPEGLRPGFKIPRSNTKDDRTYVQTKAAGSFEPPGTPQSVRDHAQKVYDDSSEFLRSNPVPIPFRTRNGNTKLLCGCHIRNRAEQNLASRPPVGIVTIPFSGSNGPRNITEHAAVATVASAVVSKFTNSLHPGTVRTLGIDPDSPHMSTSPWTQLKLGRTLRQVH